MLTTSDLLQQTWFQYLQPAIQDLTKQAFYLYLREDRLKPPSTPSQSSSPNISSSQNSPIVDYSFIVFPMAKAYEGFLKQYFVDLELTSQKIAEGRHFRIGRSLNPDIRQNQRDRYWLYDDVAKMCGQKTADQLWQTWLECRNRLFHFFPGKSRQISLEESGRKLMMAAKAMAAAVACQADRLVPDTNSGFDFPTDSAISRPKLPTNQLDSRAKAGNNELLIAMAEDKSHYKHITISGLPGAGSTTLLEHLKTKLVPLGWQGFSGGQFMQLYAEEKGLFDKSSGTHHDASHYEDDFDRQVDMGMRQKLKEEQHWILESWLSGFMAQGVPRVLKVLMTCSNKAVRIDRIVNRDGMKTEEAISHINDRYNNNFKKWRRMYRPQWERWVVKNNLASPGDPIDFWQPNLYDVVLDTYSLNQEQVTQAILGVLGNQDDLKNTKKDQLQD